MNAECPTCGNRGTGCAACRPELHERPGETYPDEEDAARYLAHVDLENARLQDELSKAETEPLIGLPSAGAVDPAESSHEEPALAVPVAVSPGGPGEPSREPLPREPSTAGGVAGATSPSAPGDYVLGPASAYSRVLTAEAGLSALLARVLDEGAEFGVPDRSWPLEVRLGGLVTLFRRGSRRGRKE